MLRARISGVELLLVMNANLHHDFSHSFRKSGMLENGGVKYSCLSGQLLVHYLAYHNRLLLARKHAHGRLHLAFLVLRRLMRAGLHAAILMLSGKRPQARAVLWGTMDGLCRPLGHRRMRTYLATRQEK